MKYLRQIAYILLIIGGLNWGIFGVSGYDVVDILFGNLPMIANVVYVLVGLSAVYVILNRYVLCGCKHCMSSNSDCCNKKDESIDSNENVIA